MKPMMAPAKTLPQLEADIAVARNTFLVATRKGAQGYTNPRTLARLDARVGHMWAQYLNAVKIRDNALIAYVRRGGVN